jgi:large subunit ribosomal protein L19
MLGNTKLLYAGSLLWCGCRVSAIVRDCVCSADPTRVGLPGIIAMNRVIEKFQEAQVRKDLPALRPGDTVRIHVRLKEAEGEKERIQPFEGVIIKKRGKSTGASFTVRRVSFGVGVERVFPANSPSISSIEVLRQGRVRRAKLYYLRGLKGKSARLKRVERVDIPATAPTEEKS